MEVLHGKQAGSGHTRRRSDKISAGENRTLHWSLEASDIHLHALSPLALADVLDQGGVLDLVPEPPADDSADQTQAGTVSRNSVLAHSPDHDLGESVREASDSHERTSLLTRHGNDELLAQCKRVLVENALVKHQGERQLYLAAGFVSWPDAANTKQKQRAPLLLYPAVLVRIANEQQYELRLSGEDPEYNEALLIHIEQLHTIRLPSFEESQSLVDFFARVADCLPEGGPLKLEMDVALGSASLVHDAGKHRLNLPDVPTHFDVGLAMSITGNKSLNQLSAVLRLIPDYQANDEKDAATGETDAGGIGAAGLRRYAAKLAAEGLDHMEFRQLPQMPAMIRQWRDTVRAGMKLPTISEVLERDDLSARELVKVSGIIELIDKAPATIEQLGHPDLGFAATTLLLRRAQHQARLIEDELVALQEHFLLDKIPAKQQLLTLIGELGESGDAEGELVGANYFNARRRYLEFSRHKPALLSKDDKRSLSQLAKVLRFRELFVNNAEYRKALGPGYKGLRTDWALLGGLSDYATELSAVIGSESLSARIIERWSDFRTHYAQDLEGLQHAAEATRRLLAAVGTRWQTQSIPALLSHSKMIAQRLEEWQQQHGTVESHADKTASMVLASFSGESLDHVLVESQVDEAHSRINQQLSAGVISREQLQDTLSWLQEASTAAASQDLDIDAIVDHLQIA